MAMIRTGSGTRIGDGMHRLRRFQHPEADLGTLSGRGEIAIRRSQSNARKSVASLKAGRR